MNILTKKVSQLKPAPYNPRINIKDDLSFYNKLNQSIQQWGLVEPFIWNKQTGHIVGGNQRLQILQDNNVEETQVVEVDLSLTEEKSLNIALNKITGDWKEDQLQVLLKELKDTDEYLLGLTGFDDKEINEILGIKEEIIEDEFRPIKEPKYKVNNGDIFILGNHRLMCGDSLLKEDIDKLMDKNKANVLITSPPYYNQREYSFFKTIEDYEKFIFTVSNNYRQILTKNGIVCWNVGGGEVEHYDLRSINSIQIWKSGLKFSDCIVWKKSGGVFDIPRSMHIEKNLYYPAFGYELIFIFKQPDGVMPHFEPSDHDLAREYQINVWEIRQVRTNAEEHPAAFPTKIPELCIRFYSTKNKIIVDPFGGSGSTLIACEQTQRHCYMMEIDPYYCSVIIERWETFTGKQHVKVNT